MPEQNSLQNRTILIAPNSFKECSDSVAISTIIYNNLKNKLVHKIIRIPISDGGDGFTEVCKDNFDAEELIFNVSAPYKGDFLECKTIYAVETKTVYVESANVLGLKVVPRKKRNPLLLSSKGLGELLLKLLDEKLDIQEVVIGIGGTATIDMGLGACSVLGLQLIDENGESLEVIPSNYGKAVDIVWEGKELPFSIQTIIDVSNPLLGEKGAARQFGPQKGADEDSIKIIENGLANILNILKNKKLYDSSKVLFGAGGGISTGISLFLGAEVISAENFIMNELKLHERIKKSDIIITGEGAFDRQSFMGKGAGIVLNKALECDKEVFLVCGTVDGNVRDNLDKNVKLFEISFLFESEEESIKNYENGLNIMCDKIAKMIQ